MSEESQWKVTQIVCSSDNISLDFEHLFVSKYSAPQEIALTLSNLSVLLSARWQGKEVEMNL